MFPVQEIIIDSLTSKESATMINYMFQDMSLCLVLSVSTLFL